MPEPKSAEHRALVRLANEIAELHVVVEHMQEAVLKELRAQRPPPPARKDASAAA